MTTHVMIDLETFGTEIGSVIVAIGAVKFDPQKGEITDSVYIPVDAASCQKLGMRIDASTVWWWLHPDREAARKELLCWDERLDVSDALHGFLEWYGPNPLPTWGNGCSFDLPMMEVAYKAVNLPCPWRYSDHRDYRTIKNLPAARLIEVPPNDLAHDALHDAMWQAGHLMTICQKLEIELE